jgi:hypothetical protein
MTCLANTVTITIVAANEGMKLRVSLLMLGENTVVTDEKTVAISE